MSFKPTINFTLITKNNIFENNNITDIANYFISEYYCNIQKDGFYNISRLFHRDSIHTFQNIDHYGITNYITYLMSFGINKFNYANINATRHLTNNVLTITINGLIKPEYTCNTLNIFDQEYKQFVEIFTFVEENQKLYVKNHIIHIF